MENIVEKLKALSLAQKLVAGGGVLMLIASFMPWYSFSELGFSFTQSGWDAPGSIWSLLAIVVSLAAAGAVLAESVGNIKLPDLGPSTTWGMLYGGAGAAVAVLMLLKLWRIMAVPVGGMGWGFFVAIVAAAIVAAGGYLLYTEEKAKKAA